MLKLDISNYRIKSVKEIFSKLGNNPKIKDYFLKKYEEKIFLIVFTK